MMDERKSDLASIQPHDFREERLSIDKLAKLYR